MQKYLWRGGILSSLLTLLVLFAAGCGQDGPQQGQAKPGDTRPAQVAQKGDHSGWWCPEHGIPEAECTMCSIEAAEKAKAKGDWCEKHDRAKSQCFICDPSLKEKFARIYRAKEGKEPPPIEEEPAEPK